MRTTIDIDDPILQEVKDLQKTQGKSLGRLISDLLAQALREGQRTRRKSKPARWIARSLGARVDLSDKEALYSTLEKTPPAE